MLENKTTAIPRRFFDELEEPLISVIVPVYNVKKYLERCVNSLINQTYSKLEIILVDDGSTDGSGDLCEDFAQKDKRIVVVHKKNGGLSSARNAGIEHANGWLITFIDSDDWIQLDTYYYCLNLMREYQADVVEFNYKMVRDIDAVKQPKEKIFTFREKDILQYYMMSTTKTGSYSVCRCLFPCYAVNEIRFREGKINEDIDFKYKAFSKCEKLVTSNQYKYLYFQSGNSLSTGGLKKKDFDLYAAAEELYKLTMVEKYGKIAKLGRVKKARTAFSLLSKIAYYGIADESLEKKFIIERLLCQHKKCIILLLSSPMSISRKILAILFCINYGISEKAIKFYRSIRI